MKCKMNPMEVGYSWIYKYQTKVLKRCVCVCVCVCVCICVTETERGIRMLVFYFEYINLYTWSEILSTDRTYKQQYPNSNKHI